MDSEQFVSNRVKVVLSAIGLNLDSLSQRTCLDLKKKASVYVLTSFCFGFADGYFGYHRDKVILVTEAL